MFGVRPICGSVAAFCTWFTSGIRFYCGVLCSITPAVCLLTNRTACGMLRFYSAGSRSPFVRSRDVGAVICLCGFTSGWPFPYGDLDGITGDGGDAGNRATGGWRRGLYALLRNHIGFAMLSAGSTLGLRAPDCAKESSTLWTLFTLRRGCLSAYTRRHPGTRKDPPGSDLWPGGSGCIAMLPIRTIVQTRSAPKR